MSEDKNRATIGQRIFSEIDSDQYLNKLYSYLLFNYALKLFSPESIKPKEINYIDALRFADLLSKSNDPKKAESHHTYRPASPWCLPSRLHHRRSDRTAPH